MTTLRHPDNRINYISITQLRHLGVSVRPRQLIPEKLSKSFLPLPFLVAAVLSYSIPSPCAGSAISLNTKYESDNNTNQAAHEL